MKYSKKAEARKREREKEFLAVKKEVALKKFELEYLGYMVISPQKLDDAKKNHVLKIYIENGFNATQTAKVLGVSQKSIYNYFEKWGFEFANPSCM
ncbi:MAG: hypothetical protein DRQ88_06070 [Epsilonproteobacteria bacterium]|nr:MAG: hypothetical protein DRQ88_06070 [Campylobacterota bacterium]